MKKILGKITAGLTVAAVLLTFIPNTAWAITGISCDSTLPDGIFAHWSLEEASGTRADDVATSTPNNLTDNGTTGNAVGKVGNAVSTNGSTKYLSIADNDALSMSVASDRKYMTLAAWVNITFTGNGDADDWLVAKFRSADDNREYGLSFSADASKTMEFRVSSAGTSGNGSVYATTFGVLTTGAWYFVVAYYDGTNIGISVSSDNGTDNPNTFNTTAFSSGIFNGAAAFQIGAREGTSGAVNALVDQVGLWKRVLSATEITNLYKAGAGLIYTCPVAAAAAVVNPFSFNQYFVGF